MVKVTIESAERCERLKIGSNFIELETKRDKNDKWISSKAYLEVNEDEIKPLEELGKNAGFKVTKGKK